jgi:hypothetical protein
MYVHIHKPKVQSDMPIAETVFNILWNGMDAKNYLRPREGLAYLYDFVIMLADFVAVLFIMSSSC